MTVITLRLTALALYGKPSLQVNAPPHYYYHDVYSHPDYGYYMPV